MFWQSLGHMQVENRYKSACFALKTSEGNNRMQDCIAKNTHLQIQLAGFTKHIAIAQTGINRSLKKNEFDAFR